MRWMPMVVLAAILTCSGAFGQSNTNPEQAVMRIEKEMLDALLKGDAAASEKYLAESYMFTGPDGDIGDRAKSISDIKTGAIKLQAASIDDPKVQAYGDTVVVTFTSNDKGTYKGKDISGKSRWTDVFVRKDGKWQLVATHGSMVTVK
jgi:hypothetical protein